MNGPKAFISFCTADRTLAQRLQRDLGRAGCASWQFDISAVPGTDAWETILERIEQSDFFLVLLSQAAVESRGVSEEISHAHYHSLNNPAGVPRIIPLLLEEDVSVPRKIERLVRLPFHENVYEMDFATLQRSLGIEASPFDAATALEVTSTRSYEFDPEREAARYATSLITNNNDVRAVFEKLSARARGSGGARFHISSPQVISQSEEVSRYHVSAGPAVSVLQTFWVIFGLMEGHTKGYVVAENITMQIDASQNRCFEDVGDDRLLRSDSLRLRFEGFQNMTVTPLP